MRRGAAFDVQAVCTGFIYALAVAGPRATPDTMAQINHIDSHFASLATLANRLLAFDRHLKAGDLVITGAFGRQNQPESGVWHGDFGELIGRVSLVIDT